MSSMTTFSATSNTDAIELARNVREQVQAFSNLLNQSLQMVSQSCGVNAIPVAPAQDVEHQVSLGM